MSCLRKNNMSKKLWILANRSDQALSQTKRDKISGSVAYAKKKNLPYEVIYIEDIVLDTTASKKNLPGKGDFLLSVVKSETRKEKTRYILHFFQSSGVKLVNSPDAIEIMADKWLTNSILAHAGIPVPHTRLITLSEVYSESDFSDFSFPVVVKTPEGSLGNGVYWIENYRELEDLLSFSYSVSSKESQLLVQQAIVASKGTDIRVIISHGTVIGAIKRTNPGHSFKANLKQGGSATLYPTDEKLIKLSKKIASVLGVNFAGIDFLVDDQKNYYLTEVNAFPGFKGFESVHTSVSLVQELVDRYL